MNFCSGATEPTPLEYTDHVNPRQLMSFKATRWFHSWSTHADAHNATHTTSSECSTNLVSREILRGQPLAWRLARTLHATCT